MDNQKQLELCKKCIYSELVEFTDDTKSYYLCHLLNEKTENINFLWACGCYWEGKENE
jgi:hypothetical protein